MHLRTLVILVALGTLLGACGSDTARDDAEHGEHGPQGSVATFAAGEATQTVELGLQNYAFVGVSPTVSGPNVELTADNKTTTPHEVAVYDEAGEEIGAIAAFVSGTKSLRLVLEPGRYQLRCLVKEGARTHAELGMVATLVVG